VLARAQHLKDKFERDLAELLSTPKMGTSKPLLSTISTSTSGKRKTTAEMKQPTKKLGKIHKQTTKPNFPTVKRKRSPYWLTPRKEIEELDSQASNNVLTRNVSDPFTRPTYSYAKYRHKEWTRRSHGRLWKVGLKILVLKTTSILGKAIRLYSYSFRLGG
jgi:hypothetical protein